MKEMQGYVLITVASILWGTLGILAKLSFEHGVLPETLIALRLVISFATLSAVLAIFSKDSFKVKKTDALLFLIFGVFATALQRISYFYTVDLTTVTVAAILFYTYPVFVTISASLFLKEKITSRELLAIILTFSGAALVAKVYDSSSLKVNLIGIIFGLLSSLLFTLYFMMTKKLRNRYTSWTLTLYGDGIGVLTLTPVISLSIPQIINFPLQLWLLIFTIAWIPSLLAYLLYSYALKYVKASKGSILSVIEPLSAALFSTIFIGENLENPQIVGIALALIGVALLFQMKQKRITRGSE
ncbi:MAG: DMT family transporter [Candidatus Bathyarchaeota archaeon]|nr:DMT family transporter [Candidatus Bathyarchaeota archaeon]